MKRKAFIRIACVALCALTLAACGKKAADTATDSVDSKGEVSLPVEESSDAPSRESSDTLSEEDSFFADNTEDISVEEMTAKYEYMLGMKRFEKSEGTLTVRGVAITCESDTLKTRVSRLFEEGDTTLKLVLDRSFSINGVKGELLAQAYRIEVDGEITVTAASEVGLYYGALTVSQYAAVQDCIPKGVYTDWPDVKERCLHLDIARKYYEKDFIIDAIKHAATFKMNAVELHFSENEGFRIECETDPAIMSEEYLTKNEVREIIAAAKELYVDIIPSFDSPGHLLKVLKVHPEYSLTDIDGYNSPKTLDITNPEAVAYIKSLLDEYGELFSDCRHFNIGGDESFGWSDVSRMQFSAWKVLENYAKATYGEAANAHDAFVGYINDIAAHMKAKGFTVRAWNDGLIRTMEQAAVVEPDKELGVCFWTNSSTLRAADVSYFLNGGYTVYNVNETYMYYVLKEDFDQPKATEIYKEWNAAIFNGKKPGSATPDSVDGDLAGAYFCIWCDRPDTQTPEEVKAGAYRPMAAMAVKSWNSNPQVIYANFAAQYNLLCED